MSFKNKLNEALGSLEDYEDAFIGSYRKILEQYPKEQAERIIAQNPEWAWEYASKLGRRWPPGEEVIKTDPKASFLYARYVIGDRWPPEEEVIKTYPRWAVNYARDVIKGRWPEAEDVIKTDVFAAYFYATAIIKDRWPEAEETIYASDWSMDYVYFMRGLERLRGKS